jgi:hypothetical protein
MAQQERSDWIAVFGHHAGLAWVLQNRKLGFAAERQREVRRLHAGDRVLLYAATAIYGKGKRARGRLIGAADATSDVHPLDQEIQLAGRTYGLGATLDLQGLAEYGTGIEIPPLLGRVKVFPTNQPNSWPPMLQRPLLRLMPDDFLIIIGELQPLLRAPDETVAGYLRP